MLHLKMLLVRRKITFPLLFLALTKIPSLRHSFCAMTSKFVITHIMLSCDQSIIIVELKKHLGLHKHITADSESLPLWCRSLGQLCGMRIPTLTCQMDFLRVLLAPRLCFIYVQILSKRLDSADRCSMHCVTG